MKFYYLFCKFYRNLSLQIWLSQWFILVAENLLSRYHVEEWHHHETLLPPNKAATESPGIATLDGMAEHLVKALKQKLEVPLATAVETVVGRATEQLKTNVGRVFDQAQQEAEAEVARLEEVEAELHRRAGARTQDTLLLDGCVCQLCTGKVACVICSNNAAVLIHETMKKSLFLMSNGGIQLDKRATARFREHKGGAMHLLCAQAQSDAAADSIPAAITREREKGQRRSWRD